MEQLFTQALGLTAPWAVTGFDFRPIEGAIHFTAECQANRLPCPACGAADQPIHDCLPRRWQHLHFFQFKAFIDARVPRVACSACGKTSQTEVPWSRPGSGFSAVMEAFVIALCQGLPVAQVARLLGVSADRVWRVLEHYIPTARSQQSLVDLTQLAVDETSSRRGQFISVFFDASQRRLAYATPGRDASTFKRFAEDLKARGGDSAAITDISMDMAAGFQAGARAQCPQAALSFDPFHVVQLANTALDEVRRAETKREPALKGSRWGLLKSSEKWSFKQLTLMHHLLRSGMKSARAWRLKEALRKVYREADSREDAEPMLHAWISWARRSRLPAFKRLGQTLRTHLQGILGHFESGLSNGFLEAMNGLIHAAKVRARGYRTDSRLILMAYLVCGKLRHLPANPWLAYHVTSRGDRREAIYEDNGDRERCLELLAQVAAAFNWVVHAYCLMRNHYHLLIETPDTNLSKGMRQLNGVFTQDSNRRHPKTGVTIAPPLSTGRTKLLPLSGLFTLSC